MADEIGEGLCSIGPQIGFLYLDQGGSYRLKLEDGRDVKVTSDGRDGAAYKFSELTRLFLHDEIQARKRALDFVIYSDPSFS